MMTAREPVTFAQFEAACLARAVDWHPAKGATRRTP